MENHRGNSIPRQASFTCKKTKISRNMEWKNPRVIYEGCVESPLSALWIIIFIFSREKLPPALGKIFALNNGWSNVEIRKALVFHEHCTRVRSFVRREAGAHVLRRRLRPRSARPLESRVTAATVGYPSPGGKSRVVHISLRTHVRWAERKRQKESERDRQRRNRLAEVKRTRNRTNPEDDLRRLSSLPEIHWPDLRPDDPDQWI